MQLEDSTIDNGTEPASEESLTGSCFIVGMPIAEQDDFTTRGVRTLQGADLVVTPDERETARLLKRFAISKPLMGIGEEIADDVAEGVMERLRNGERVVIMTASVVVESDPVRWLANRIRQAGLEPRVVPGIDLANMALVMSGFPSDRYFVAGYMPTRRDQRDEFVGDLSRRTETTVLFASGARLTSSLLALTDGVRGREAAVILKPTVPGEVAVRGPIEEVKERLASKMLSGTVAIVLGPVVPVVAPDKDIARE